ncbi:nitroreductase [Tepidicaulis marinus]|jgi:nitroreductase|uniref:Nitroreductase n=1 Tax=Tepidicaulis marinus TaxID=1333998 RepID=A0A081BAT5_9HYPH|nr:nitroreductase [Tepidicaulis marinus]GAK45153.1 nitroreductase [Tepidicaulis marinus]
MNVSEALATRITCRDFLDTPVPPETVRKILENAKRAPSGGNLQPWNVWVLGGDRLKEFKKLIAEKLPQNPAGEGTEYDIYPKGLKEPYRSRRTQCGEDMYGTIGVAREDKTGRMMQFARNFDLFGAPVALFFAMDRQMGYGQWADLGMFMQSIMLSAREEGLHTAPQEAWAIWYKTLGEFLNIPEEMMLFCGMGLGYMNEEAPINTLRTARAPLEEFVVFDGI